LHCRPFALKFLAGAVSTDARVVKDKIKGGRACQAAACTCSDPAAGRVKTSGAQIRQNGRRRWTPIKKEMIFYERRKKILYKK